MFNNAEWNDSYIGFVGLPRPFSKVLEQHQISHNLASKVPIPWQSKAQNDQNVFLKIVQENEDIVYSKNLCSYCGVTINNEDDVVRWKNKELDKIKHDGRFVLSDIHPLHINCMKQTRVYCPGMKKKKEEEFEYGKYIDLNKKAKSERKFVIKLMIENFTNVFYFTADWCQPCKKIKPIIKEINRDKSGLKFHMIDADTEQDLVQKFNIQSLPTFIIINQGKEIKRLVGLQTKENLQEFLTFAEKGNYEEIVQKDI